jgi:hypothetical protein
MSLSSPLFSPEGYYAPVVSSLSKREGERERFISPKGRGWMALRAKPGR